MKSKIHIRLVFSSLFCILRVLQVWVYVENTYLSKDMTQHFSFQIIQLYLLFSLILVVIYLYIELCCVCCISNLCSYWASNFQLSVLQCSLLSLQYSVLSSLFILTVRFRFKIQFNAICWVFVAMAKCLVFKSVFIFSILFLV